MYFFIGPYALTYIPGPISYRNETGKYVIEKLRSYGGYLLICKPLRQ